MAYTKKFKVAETIYRLKNGTHHLILIGVQGECYRVQIDQLKGWVEVWQVGRVIELSMVVAEEGPTRDRTLVPDFSELGPMSPTRLYFVNSNELIEMLTRHWGKDALSRLPAADIIVTTLGPQGPTDERMW